MKQKNDKMNKKMFFILIIVIIVVIALFTYFIYLFTRYDKTEYSVETGSVLYNSDLEYIKVAGDAYITQKFDQNYYLYEVKNGEKTREKLGKNTFVYKEGSMHMFIYGTAYQVMSTGDVDTLSGETKVVISKPTKFFKMDDRRYLIVDDEIRSSESDVLDTKDFVLINVDKKGKPSFSNHLIDFKTNKQINVKTSIFNFDIANEKLSYDKKEIDLKNVIGSSNEYEPPKKEATDYTDEKLQAIQNNISDSSNAIVGYYDQYFNDVVSSVNNLTQSITGVHNNTLAGLSKEETYYDFDKWLALKSVVPRTSAIDVEYSIFDPTNDFQAVHLIVNGPAPAPASGTDPDSKTYTLSKSESKISIRDLLPNTQYEVTLGYTNVGSLDVTLEDTVVVNTKKDSYELTVPKIIFGDSGTEIEYKLNLDPEYRFTSAKIVFDSYRTRDDYVANHSSVNHSETEISGNSISGDEHIGRLELPNDLQLVNIIKLVDVTFCDAMGTCTVSDVSKEYLFFNSSAGNARPQNTPTPEPTPAAE